MMRPAALRAVIRSVRKTSVASGRTTSGVVAFQMPARAEDVPLGLAEQREWRDQADRRGDRQVHPSARVAGQRPAAIRE